MTKIAATFPLSIPGKPQRWKRPEQVTLRSGRTMRYTDPDVRAYTERVAWEAKRLWGSAPPWTGPVVVSMVAVFAIPESWPAKTKQAAAEGRVMHIADPDIDQLIKALLDALRGIVFVDDNQICGFIAPVSKRYGAPERLDAKFYLLAQGDGETTPGQRRLEAKQAQLAMGLGNAPRRRGGKA